MKRDAFFDGVGQSDFPSTEVPGARDSETERKAKRAMARICANRSGVVSTFGDSIERSTFDEPEQHLEVKPARKRSLWAAVRGDLGSREALGINRLLVYMVMVATAVVAVIFRIESSAVRLNSEMVFAVAALLIGLAVLASVYVQASASAEAVEKIAKKRVAEIKK